MTSQSTKNLLPTPPVPADLPEIDLSENSHQVLCMRYVRKGAHGELIETPKELF